MNDAGRKAGVLAREVSMPRHETSSGGDKPQSVVIQSSHPAVLAAVKDFAASIEKKIESDEAILDEVTFSVLADLREAQLEQMRSQMVLRLRFLREVPFLHEIPDASRLKAERRVLAQSFANGDRFPAFQFSTDGKPLPAMHEILEIFAGLSAWQIALWFFAPNAWLGNEPPMNVLQRDPATVIAAARHAIEPLEV